MNESLRYTTLAFRTTVSYFVVCDIHACVLLACCGKEGNKPKALLNYTCVKQNPAYHVPSEACNCATGTCLLSGLPCMQSSDVICCNNLCNGCGVIVTQ